MSHRERKRSSEREERKREKERHSNVQNFKYSMRIHKYTCEGYHYVIYLTVFGNKEKLMTIKKDNTIKHFMHYTASQYNNAIYKIM